MSSPITRTNDALRAELERRRQEYIARGGITTEIPIGVSAENAHKPRSADRTESMRRLIKRGCNEHGVSLDA